MAWQVRTFAALAEALSLVYSHQRVHKGVYLQLLGIQHRLLASTGSCMHACVQPPPQKFCLKYKNIHGSYL